MLACGKWSKYDTVRAAGLRATYMFTSQVVQDFQQPEGTSKEEMDAAGDGEVLVVLDLR